MQKAKGLIKHKDKWLTNLEYEEVVNTAKGLIKCQNHQKQQFLSARKRYF